MTTPESFAGNTQGDPVYEEYPCTEDNHWVPFGGELYFTDGEGYLMPVRKGQKPPDLRYFDQSQQ